MKKIEIEKLKERIKKIEFELENKSNLVKAAYRKFGRIFEQYAPFTKNFPGDKSKFVFLGKPIDGIIFDEDSIKFIEIKTNGGFLTPNQLKIKKQVEKGNVEFREVRYR